MRYKFSGIDNHYLVVNVSPDTLQPQKQQCFQFVYTSPLSFSKWFESMWTDQQNSLAKQNISAQFLRPSRKKRITTSYQLNASAFCAKHAALISWYWWMFVLSFQSHHISGHEIQVIGKVFPLKINDHIPLKQRHEPQANNNDKRSINSTIYLFTLFFRLSLTLF